jgi:hypothetical protein
MNPRVFRTGDPLVDRQNREFASANSSYVATVTIRGQSRPVIKRVQHLLGSTPNSWSVARAMPDDASASSPQEVRDGEWSRSECDILFPGSGTWDIRFS